MRKSFVINISYWNTKINVWEHAWAILFTVFYVFAFVTRIDHKSSLENKNEAAYSEKKKKKNWKQNKKEPTMLLGL